MRWLGLFLLAFDLSLGTQAAENPILSPGVELQKLTNGFSFTEGPACDAFGNVFFTDQPNDRILRWGTDGQLSVYMSPCGRANGLSFDREGNLWACADENNQLWRIAPSGRRTIMVREYEGKPLNGPNDVWIVPGGGLYFTDPYYKRPYWDRGPKAMDECVYHLSPDGKKLTRVADDLKQPNGLIGTPDGKTLYIADIGAGKTYRYSIAADRSLKDKTLFCELGSDGMTIDDRGDIYLTGKQGVSVYDKTGKFVTLIKVPEPWTANVCFGGKDHQTLFITASGALYGIHLNVHGVGSQ